MPSKIKVHIKERLHRTVPLEDIVDSFTSMRTYSNYRAVLNKVNEHYGWKKDVIHYDEMSRNVEEIAEFFKEEYDIKSHDTLKQKLGSLSSLMTRTDMGGNHAIKHYMKDIEMKIKVDTIIAKWDVPNWINDLKPKLVALGNEGNKIKNIIAKIYSHGYVMRVASLFDTKLVDDGVSNFLDLDKCIWYIRHQKNGTIMDFKVDPQLCKELYSKRKWLLAKQDGSPYNRAAKILKYHKWDLSDCATIRISFETWNILQSNNEPEEQLEWHKILGHTRAIALKYYNP